MAKTLHTIEMDFRNAKKQAEELEQIAQELSILADDSFSSCIAGIAADWKGENAAVFCKKGKIVANNIRHSADGLRKTAALMRQIAENTYNAEKKNYEIAQGRSI